MSLIFALNFISSSPVSPETPAAAAPEMEMDLLGLDSDYVHTDLPVYSAQAAAPAADLSATDATDDLLDFLSEGAPAPFAAPAVEDLLSGDLLSDDLLSAAPVPESAVAAAPAAAETEDVAEGVEDAEEAEAEEASANVSVRDRSSSGTGAKKNKKVSETPLHLSSSVSTIEN